MKDLVQFVAKQLVNNPDAVEVRETQGEVSSLLELRVAKEDLGRIIGKQAEPPRRSAFSSMPSPHARGAEPPSKLLKTNSDRYGERARVRDEAFPKID